VTDSRRAWESVLHHVEARLLSGELGPGDHLPPERALAMELGVGRSTVREAVRVLEVLGLLRTQTGSGPQAGAIILARPSGGMSALMRLQVAANGFPIDDVVKTRLMLESAIVRELADAKDVIDLRTPTSLLDAMDAVSLSPAEFLALDAAFHLALAEASGNSVVTAIMAGLRDSIESYVLAGVPSLPDWPSAAEQLRREHRGIVTAIADGSSELAATQIHSHITGYYAATNLTAQRE
jgi:GntR family transcriptional repressor for pyruvate dehydrogenase complex